MDLKLEKKVVLVTGGSKGIGEGIVRSFAAEKAIVVIVNRSGGEGEDLRDELNSAGGETYFVKADLTDNEQCKFAVEETLRLCGRLDVLVNNAGLNDSVSLETGVAEFEQSLKNNLVHLYALVHYSLDALKESRGNIINIGSKVADTGQGGTSGYAASKGGCNALTREWAVELAPFGIRSNAVIPAEVMTPLYERWVATLDNPQETLDKICNSIPFERRMTEKEELADMVVFLASARSSHTTGQLVYVDGGYTHLDRKCTL
ncbi:MAG: SDR family oxidoreductase [Lentisphaeraceae bacterium]|nr:SDR family oxidoreductase [Lentisphaeraceae bacterium]